MLRLLAILVAAATVPAQSLTTSKASYVVGEHLAVQFAGSTSPTDWAGVYPAGAPHGSGNGSLYWQYTNGQTGNTGPVIPSGRLTFLPFSLPEGAYDARLFANGGYTVLAQATFQVASGAISPVPPATGDLTIMSFNIWVNGGRGFGGLPRVADLIAAAGVDIIGLQESNSSTTNQILALLRQKPGYAQAQASGAAAVISRYPITATYARGLRGYGVKVQLPSRTEVRFFNSHLTPYPYGPYSIRDGRGVQAALAEELATRHAEMTAILNQLVDDAANEPSLPTFLVGDHNTPSHLDWTPANTDQNFGVAVQWPVSVLLYSRGFRDLHREVRPDPVVDRELTWSPGYPKGTLTRDDVHDRIDMVYFRRGSQYRDLVAVQAYTLDQDPWPADHRAVVASVDWVDWPGTVTRSDLELRGTCSATGTSSAFPEIVFCMPQDVLRIELDSSTGRFTSTPALLAMQCALTGTSPVRWPQYPASLLNPTLGGVEVLMFDITGLAGGRLLSATVPPGLAGTSCLLQGFALVPAANGLFEASNALQVRL